MKWLQTIQQQFSQHKYAINAKQLGDNAELAWSNLGYWDDAMSSYPDACRQLADRLAQAVHLNSNDSLLDLGCGQGASLVHWQQHYHVQHIEAVELQASCVIQIQKHLPQLAAIHQRSFLKFKNRFSSNLALAFQRISKMSVLISFFALICTYLTKPST